METKFGKTLEIKAGAEPGTFEGKASVYGVVDSYGDVVMPGAFTDTLAKNGNRIKVLAQHNPSDVIGLATLTDRADALYFKAKLELALPSAQEMYTRLKAGLIDGISIGYAVAPGGSSFDRAGHRLLSKIDLWEISAVTFPANQLATVTDVKTAEVKAAEIIDTLARMNLELKIGRVFSAANEDILKGIHDALFGVTSDLEAHRVKLAALLAQLDAVS